MKSIRARAPKASSPTIRKVMQANVGDETLPHGRVREVLKAHGLTFTEGEAAERSLRCKPDFIFRDERVCVFVDGCFWHRCPIHFRIPKTNTEWWDEKIQANAERDTRQTRQLEARGWVVVRLWEHGTVSPAVESVAQKVSQLVRERHAKVPSRQLV